MSPLTSLQNRRASLLSRRSTTLIATLRTYHTPPHLPQESANYHPTAIVLVGELKSSLPLWCLPITSEERWRGKQRLTYRITLRTEIFTYGKIKKFSTVIECSSDMTRCCLNCELCWGTWIRRRRTSWPLCCGGSNSRHA